MARTTEAEMVVVLVGHHSYALTLAEVSDDQDVYCVECGSLHRLRRGEIASLVKRAKRVLIDRPESSYRE
jgi:hypothetical protein